SNPALTHTPSLGGYYTATVSAINSVGVVTATTVYTINNPTPAATTTIPSVTAAPANTPMVVNGTGFVSGAVVQIQLTTGGAITTYTPSLVTSTSLSITITGTDLQAGKTYNLWVINPEPPVALPPRKSAPITFSVS
ncbi:MAG: hypothetical protein ABI847_14580, partial [Anaerolineales bacterium]